MSWGEPAWGGDNSSVYSKLNGTNKVVEIFSGRQAFAALREDGSVVTWGHQDDGGNNSNVATEINGDIDVITIETNEYAFAALRADGSVVTWGDVEAGADSSAVRNELDGSIPVLSITANLYSFAAVRADGSVITWGDANRGANSSQWASEFSGNGSYSALQDSDKDSMSNQQEWLECMMPYQLQLGSSPCLNVGFGDTDGDGIWDNLEIENGTNPRHAVFEDSMKDLNNDGHPDHFILPGLNHPILD